MNTSRYTMYDTNFMHSVNGVNTSISAMKFLTQHPEAVFPSDGTNNFMKNLLIETPITLLFKKLYLSGYVSNITGLYLSKNVATNIPELLTYPNLPLDVKALPGGVAFQSRSYLQDKVVCNITSFLKDTNNSGLPQPVDLNNIHGVYVKSSFVMSYHDYNNLWMTIPLCLYLVKSYAITLSSVIAKFYSFDLTEKLQICYPLALYMCKLLTTDSDAAERLFSNCKFLGNSSVMSDYYTETEDKYFAAGNIPTIRNLCDMILEQSPSRANTMTPEIFIRLTRTLGSTLIDSLLCIEYPPFWMYQIISSLSNNKVRLYFELKNNRLLEEAKRFAYDLINISNYLDKVQR